MNTKDWTISAIITIVGGLFVAVVGGLLLHAILNKLNKKTPKNKINNKEKAQNIPTEIKQSKKTTSTAMIIIFALACVFTIASIIIDLSYNGYSIKESNLFILILVLTCIALCLCLAYCILGFLSHKIDFDFTKNITKKSTKILYLIIAIVIFMVNLAIAILFWFIMTTDYYALFSILSAIFITISFTVLFTLVVISQKNTLKNLLFLNYFVFCIALAILLLNILDISSFDILFFIICPISISIVSSCFMYISQAITDFIFAKLKIMFYNKL